MSMKKKQILRTALALLCSVTLASSGISVYAAPSTEELEQKTSNILENVDTNIEYKIGEHIYFDMYGEGVIVAIKDKVLTVAFKHPYGVKMLMKGHKKIRKV